MERGPERESLPTSHNKRPESNPVMDQEDSLSKIASGDNGSPIDGVALVEQIRTLAKPELSGRSRNLRELRKKHSG